MSQQKSWWATFKAGRGATADSEPDTASAEAKAVKAARSLVWLGRFVILMVGVLPVLGLFPPLSLLGGAVFISLWGHPVGQWFSILMLLTYVGFVVVFWRGIAARRDEIVILAIIALALTGMMLWIALG